MNILSNFGILAEQLLILLNEHHVNRRNSHKDIDSFGILEIYGEKLGPDTGSFEFWEHDTPRSNVERTHQDVDDSVDMIKR